MKPMLAFATVLLFPVLARGYLVANSMPMDDLIKEADVIIKGTVVSSEKTDDASFKPFPSWGVFSARMKVIQVLKGTLAEKAIDFHHYDDDVAQQAGRMFSPQHYHFDRGRSYIVFAKNTQTPGLLRPLWDYHRSQEDQGQILTADDKPLPPGTTVKQAIFDELARLAHGDKADDVRYAISHLQTMSVSGDRFRGTPDFSHDKVVSILAPLLDHADPHIADAAIDAIGSHSPYLSGDWAMGWLATVGKGTLLPRGHGKYPENWDNPDTCKLRGKLVEIAGTGSNPVAVRAKAVRALGLCKADALLEPLAKWSSDPAAEVRAAAALLWADFPGEQGNKHLTRLAADPDVSVRRAVAAAIGFTQSPDLLPLLETFLCDKDEHLRATAAMSAVSFDPNISGPLLKKFVRDDDFRASFIDALALDDPKPWLDDLAQIVLNNQQPKLYFVAQMPVYTSWQILKAEMESRDLEELAGGKLDKYLDALDHPPDIGSGPFTEMYQFYLAKGLRDRAARFRQETKRRITAYDIEYFFNQVDRTARP
jgi:hypothetical protein